MTEKMIKYKQYMILFYNTKNSKIIRSKFWLTKRNAEKYFSLVKNRWQDEKFNTIRRKNIPNILCVLYGKKEFGDCWEELNYCFCG
jgi:hypothetical protein